MNRKIIYILLAAALMLTGCGTQTTQTDAGSGATPVETLAVSKGSIKTEYIFTGEVAPIEKVSVGVKMPGKAVSVNYGVGDEVSAGSTLLTVDSSSIQNTISVLRSQLAGADAAINAARIGVELANGSAMQSQILAAKAGLDQAQLALNSAKQAYNDNKILYDAGYISRQTFEQIEDGYNKAQIAYNQAKESYDILVGGASSENEKRAQAALDQAIAAKSSILAQIASQESTLGDAFVTSPISGTVTASNVKAGEMVSGAIAPFEISVLSVVTIDIHVTEQNVNAIVLGQSVDVEIATISDQRIKGTVKSVSPAADAATGTYAVRIAIDNPDKTLKPGMFGKVYLVREQSDDTLLLPRSAVIGTGGDQYVFVDENGVARKTAVTTGIDNGQEIAVKSGLAEGQSVVVKGQTFLKDGDAISTVSAAKGE